MGAKDALGGGLRQMLYSTASSCLPPSYTLCVKGLSPRTNDEGLRFSFARFGHVLRAKVEYDHKKQKSKTYGFVTYSSLDAAAAGIKGMSGQFLDGWIIFAEYERPNHIVPRPYTTIIPGKRNCSSYGFPACFNSFQVSPFGDYAKGEEAKKRYDSVMYKVNHTNGKQEARKQFIEKGIKEGSDPTLTTKCIREVVDKQCMRKGNERSDLSDPMLVTSNYASNSKEVGKQWIRKGDAVNLNDLLATMPSEATMSATMPSEATMSAATASKMRQHMPRKDIQSEIDDSAASGDNALVSSTRSQSDSQTSSKKIKKFKNVNEQSLKLDESIAILAGVCKAMLDDQKLPVKVEELWGVINEMELNDNLAGDAFVFLLERPVHVKALMSTPIGIRKSILVKMIRGAKK